VSGNPLDNKLLASLPRSDFDALMQRSAVMELPQGTIVCEAGDEASEVLFPVSGMISLVVVMRNGKAIETATVGKEGVVSAMAGFGIYVSQVRAVVQINGSALRVPAAAFRKLVAASPAIWPRENHAHARVLVGDAWCAAHLSYRCCKTNF
jgi:CRP-like cAMP-binding protein